MRDLVFIFCFFAIAFSLQGQDKETLNNGKVSYMTSQNVYVKFQTTEKINIGDTLLVTSKGKMMPALIVNNKSSISCVCSPISNANIKVSDEIFIRKSKVEKTLEENSPVVHENDAASSANQPRYRANDSFYESVVLDPEGNRIEITV